MKANALKALSGVVLLFAAACAGTGGAGSDSTRPTQAGTPANDAAARAAIQAADSQFVAAFKAGDAAAAAAGYTEDAMSMPPNMEPESGRAAIQQGFAEMFKAIGKLTDFTAEQKGLDIFGDRAIETGTYSMSFMPAGAKEAMKDHGSFMNYLKKQPDGSWKVYRDAIVSAMPMTPPPPAKK